MTLKAVVDPNVFISAQISSLGHPARIARAADEGIFELVVQYSPPAGSAKCWMNPTDKALGYCEGTRSARAYDLSYHMGRRIEAVPI